MRLDFLLLGLPCFVLGRSIAKRATPDEDAGCKTCLNPSDAEWKQWEADTAAISPDLLAEAADAHMKVFREGYKPPICEEAGVNCFYLGFGVDWEPNGTELRKPIGIWNTSEGRKIYAFVYWNNTQKFGGEHGSVNIYAAHCCVEIIVNPGARAAVVGKTFTSGGGYGGKGKYCHYDNYADIYITLAEERSSMS